MIRLLPGSNNQFNADRYAWTNGSLGAKYGLLAVGYSQLTEMDPILSIQPRYLIPWAEIERPKPYCGNHDGDGQAYEGEASYSPPVSRVVHLALLYRPIS